MGTWTVCLCAGPLLTETCGQLFVVVVLSLREQLVCD